MATDRKGCGYSFSTWILWQCTVGGINKRSIKGHENIIQLLIEQDADIHAKSGIYSNALQAASYGGHEIIVQLLIKESADVNTELGNFGNVLKAAS